MDIDKAREIQDDAAIDALCDGPEEVEALWETIVKLIGRAHYLLGDLPDYSCCGFAGSPGSANLHLLPGLFNDLFDSDTSYEIVEVDRPPKHLRRSVMVHGVEVFCLEHAEYITERVEI
jgi:hypothetical protein